MLAVLVGRDLKCIAFADGGDDDPRRMWVALSPLRDPTGGVRGYDIASRECATLQTIPP